jgi:probable HAF family extracellular repeat protein
MLFIAAGLLGASAMAAGVRAEEPAAGCAEPGAALAASRAASAVPQAASAASRAVSAVPLYRAIAIPLRPAAIDEAGDVAGTTGDHRAALWSRGGGLRVLPLPEGFAHSEAVAINRRGEVAGVAYDEAYKNHRAFVYGSNGLRLLGGEGARAVAIGAGGEVVGEALLPGSVKSAAVIWRAETPLPLDSCCGGSAKAINAKGAVVGEAYDAAAHYHAVLWTAGNPALDIGPKDGYSVAIAINDRGVVVIESLGRVFLHDSSGLERLALAPKGPSHPRAINGCGVVVGAFGPFSDAAHAFVWSRAAGFADLNGRLSADTEGWKLEAASGINDRGEIVGRGDTRQADDVGFLLIPAP